MYKRKSPVSLIYTWRKIFQLDTGLIIVYFIPTLQYSVRMTNKDLPSELLKIKGREPLPQNYLNHMDNMTSSKTCNERSVPFKSKWTHRLQSSKKITSQEHEPFRAFLALTMGLYMEIFYVLIKLYISMGACIKMILISFILSYFVKSWMVPLIYSSLVNFDT